MQALLPLLAVLPFVSAASATSAAGLAAPQVLVSASASKVSATGNSGAANLRRRAQLSSADPRRALVSAHCPEGMALVSGGYCVDRYEASLVEVLDDGREQAWPFNMPVDGHHVRALSEADVMPQAHISGAEAAVACKASGKRLCKMAEWRKACRGRRGTAFPYGPMRAAYTCNDHGRSPMAALGLVHMRADGTATEYGEFETMNHPALNEVPGTLAPTGGHEQCLSDEGVVDMVGNLHEWVDDPRGTFLGGYYQDTTQNGDGCAYSTYAHNFRYHDYSTGFRCCADATP